jgi:hypothetical protein
VSDETRGGERHGWRTEEDDSWRDDRSGDRRKEELDERQDRKGSRDNWRDEKNCSSDLDSKSHDRGDGGRRSEREWNDRDRERERARDIEERAEEERRAKRERDRVADYENRYERDNRREATGRMSPKGSTSKSFSSCFGDRSTTQEYRPKSPEVVPKIEVRSRGGYDWGASKPVATSSGRVVASPRPSSKPREIVKYKPTRGRTGSF